MNQIIRHLGNLKDGVIVTKHKTVIFKSNKALSIPKIRLNVKNDPNERKHHLIKMPFVSIITYLW